MTTAHLIVTPVLTAVAAHKVTIYILNPTSVPGFAVPGFTEPAGSPPLLSGTGSMGRPVFGVTGSGTVAALPVTGTGSMGRPHFGMIATGNNGRFEDLRITTGPLFTFWQLANAISGWALDDIAVDWQIGALDCT